jgi:excisionase family DNA binding protein
MDANTTNRTAGTLNAFDIRGSVNYLKAIGYDAATETFIRTLISRGQLSHVRVGRKFYVSRASLDAWLARAERRAR